MKTCLAVILLLVLTVAGAIPARAADDAASPRAVVKQAVDGVLALLRDPAYQSPSAKAGLDGKILTIVEAHFDFRAFTVRTLGRNWQSFSPAQQEEATKLYTTLLENTYLDRVRQYSGEEVTYGEALKLDDTKSEVRTTLVTKTGPIALNYRLYLKGGTWMVYDVIVENVSLVNNYRSQFAEILNNGKPEDLLRSLREKVAAR